MNKALKFLRAILFSVAPIFAAPAIWDGTADVSWYTESAQSYNITTAEQLAGLAQLVNEGVSNFYEKTVTLGADIFLNDTTGAGDGSWLKTSKRTWTPIGTGSHPFRGEFDGLAGRKNRKIYGLYINTEDSYQGLFGSTSYVKISNIDLLVGFISAGNRVGSLVGDAYGGSVSNVYSEVKITGKDYTGGLLGYYTGSIEKSYYVGAVNGENYVGGLAGQSGKISGTSSAQSYVKGYVHGLNYVGGVVGYIASSYNASSLVNVFMNGDVIGKNYVGGLAGLAVYAGSSSGSFTYESLVAYNSYSEANVVGEKYVGGLVGLDSSGLSNVRRKILSSYSKGRIEGIGYVGGVVGFVVKRGGSTLIDSCYHTDGDVVGTGNYVGGVVGYTGGGVTNSYHENGDISGEANIGGVVGRSDSSIVNSYSISNVKGSTDFVGGVAGYAKRFLRGANHSGGDVSGKKYVGGVVGYDSSSISTSFSKGNVYGSSNYVGGVVGYSNGKITSSYHSDGIVYGNGCVGGVSGESNDSIVSSYHSGDVFGSGSYVGGVAGYSNHYVIESYSEGNINGENHYVGGVGGFMNGSILDSYHKKGSISGKNYVGGVSGNCYNINGSFSESNVIGENYVGGLCGRAYSGTVNNSYSKGSVDGIRYVGGVIGYTNGRITSVYHTGGAVVGTGNIVGGIAGFAKDSIVSSYNTDLIIGVDTVGGVAGMDSSYIKDSYSEGAVKGKNYVGGVVGVSSGTGRYIKGKYLNIDKSCFMGDSVTGIFNVGGLAGFVTRSVDSSYSTAHVKGDDNVGGLIGSAKSSVSNSYALGNVVGDVENSSAGNDNIGGLIGYAYGDISKSFALGNVEGTTKIGGLVGRFEGSRITDSYAAGNVTGRYEGDPADQNGNLYIGGLVGVGKGILENTYSNSKVVGDENDPLYTGCLVGAANANMTIKNSYYDVEICNKLSATGDEDDYVAISGTPAQTSVAMRTQGTFTDWDFTNTWKIMDDAYPFLLVFANSITNAVVETESLDGFVYDGNEKTPSVTSVSLFGEKLTLEKGYTVSYVDNINAGDATIKVCGTGSYNGCKNISFKIKPISITPIISAISNVKYDGSEQKPNVSVYNGETLLDADSYSITFSNNVNAGTAKVEISLMGNYSGSAQADFIIEKATPIIKTSPIASNVTLGETLSTSVLSDGVADVEGTFVWTDPETIPTLDNVGYEVIFIPEDPQNYETSASIVIPVKVIDKVSVVVKVGSLIVDETLIPKGSSYTLPVNRDSTGYDFTGWYHGDELLGSAGTNIVVDENIEISAKYTPKKYTISFVNYDGNSLQETTVDYNGIPEYAGAVPDRPTTAQYTYTFAKWSPSIVKVSDNATYTAVYDSVVNEYTVTFVDYDGTIIERKSVEYGEVPSYKVPSRPNTAQYAYYFLSWDPVIVEVTKDTTYTAVWESRVNKYNITFADADGTILKTSSVAYGTVPAVPMNPTKASTEKFDYTFIGWSPSVTSVTGEATYTAVYDSNDVIYTVTFANYDGTTLQESGLKYNEKPVYSGETPSKSSTAQYTYKFKGWDSEIVEVRGAKTYNAVYDSTIRSYTVTYKNGTTSLQTGTLEYGTKPAYKGLTPTKSSTVKYTYTFAGWSPTEVAVTGDATYQAVFDSTVRTYNVVFMNGEDELQSSKVAYGFVPSYTGANPKKDSTDKFVYTFSGWAPKLVEVTGAVTYQAVFDSTLRQFMITFKNGTTTLESTLFSYGETPTCGEIPTKTSTLQYTYKFAGWSPEVENVTKAATYVARFDSTIRFYDVVFSVNGIVLQATSMKYGSVPEYTGTTPTKEATAQYTYKFKGWDSEIMEVSGAKTYNAVFDSTVRSYEIAFVNSSENLQSSIVEYGASPKFLGATPTKESTGAFTYTFKGWTPAISIVRGNQTYTAVFDSTIRKYTVSFKNNGAVLQTSMLEYGSTPVYGGSKPTRAATDSCTYIFAGWSPNLENVVDDVEYDAVFNCSVKSYPVYFVNDRSTLQTINVPYGTIPEYTGSAPEKRGSAQYSYTFAGWTPELTPVTKNTTYWAVFDSISVTGFNAGLVSPKFSIMAIGRNIQIAGARVSAAYALFDMQGRVLHKGLVSEANFNLPVPASGNYLMRVGSQIQRVNVK